MKLQSIPTSIFLRRILLADAVTCLATGIAFLFGANMFEQLLGLPARLLQYAGFSLFPFCAFLIYVAKREYLSHPMIWAIILLNALWTFDSVVLLISGWVEPTLFGNAIVMIQAFCVAVFAYLEYIGLRKSAASV
ncbi:hypothetical protein L0244_25870 [bacterium]|nr:hypothetical protein [bacterium]